MKNKKEFLVALHVLDWKQSKDEAVNILTHTGAHGAILVNNGGNVLSRSDYPNLFDIALEIKKMFPSYLIGVNPLDLTNLEALKNTPQTLDILWTDTGGVIEKDGNVFLDPYVQERLNYFKPSYYGSELFKYRKQPTKPDLVAKIAVNYFSALITSGDATGSGPSVEKIRQIREWIGPDANLGIASGMSVENIDLFLPYADIFIVASSLNTNYGNGDDFYRYDPEKIQAFRAKIDAYEKNNP